MLEIVSFRIYKLKNNNYRLILVVFKSQIQIKIFINLIIMA